MITPPRIPQVPRLTPVQFVVLESLLSCPRRGIMLRAELEAQEIERSKRAFYNVTKRLEKLGLVRRGYAVRNVGHRAVRERYYEITVAGRRAHDAARAFCARPPRELVS